MTLDPKLITCCYGECSTPLVTVQGDTASVIEPHAICGNCRTIILCAMHFEDLSRDVEEFGCPACDQDQWEIVATTTNQQVPMPDEFGCAPVYAHTYNATTRLLRGMVTVQSHEDSTRIQVMGGGLDISTPGRVLDVALSPSRQRIALVLEVQGERILEVHTDAGRPWRLRSDAPLGIDTVCFFDENRMAGLQSRHEGSLELVELRLEGGHTVSGRRLCVTSASLPGNARSHLIRVDSDHIKTIAFSGAQSWLDTIQMATGNRIQRLEIPFVPTKVIDGPNGHTLIGKDGGPVSLVKGGQVVELFAHYDLTDAIFTDDDHLCLSTSIEALKIHLPSGRSTQRHWGHAILGLRAQSGLKR